MNSFFDYLTVGSAAFAALLILVQTRGASLGAGFGSGGEINTVRRGAEKSLHQLTIITVIVFALSLVFGILR